MEIKPDSMKVYSDVAAVAFPGGRLQERNT